MLRLGTRVRLKGQNALIVARTFGSVPTYDVGFADGRIVKCAAEADLVVDGVAGTYDGLENASGIGRQ